MSFRSRFFASTMAESSAFPRCLTDLGQYSGRFPNPHDPLFATLRAMGSDRAGAPFEPADTPSAWFRRLVAPHPPEEFFARYWDREALLLHPDLDRGWLERAIEQSERVAMRSTGEGGPRISWEKNTLEQPVPSPAQRPQLLSSGGTAQIIDVQLVAPELLEVDAHLAFLGPQSTSWVTFITGPSAPGLTSHWDPYNVIVFQVRGEKRWRVDEPRRCEPTRFDSHVRTYRDADQNEAGSAREFTLRPGDVLYVPRGARHQAHSGPEGSAHLTVAITMPCRYDLQVELATRALAIARERRANRRLLGRESPVALLSQLREGIMDALDTLLASDSADVLVEDLATEAVTSAGSIYPRPNYRLEPSARFRRTPAPIHTRRRGSSAELIFGTKRCGFALEAWPLLRAICEGKTLSVDDVLRELPALGSPAEAGAWVEQLVRWGVLVEASDAP